MSDSTEIDAEHDEYAALLKKLGRSLEHDRRVAIHELGHFCVTIGAVDHHDRVAAHPRREIDAILRIDTILVLAGNSDPAFRAGPTMNDMRSRVEKLRDDAAECAMSASEVRGKKQRDLLLVLARQLTLLADQLDEVARAGLPSEAFLGGRHYDSFAKGDRPVPSGPH